MKLHLPKRLFAAILATFAVCISTTIGADVISVNFSDTDATGSLNKPGELGGVAAAQWVNIAGRTAADINGVHTLTDDAGVAAGKLLLQTSKDPWGKTDWTENTLEEQILSSYLDQSGNSTWSVALSSYMSSDITLYYSGDGGTYAPVSVNGTAYQGGTEEPNTPAEGNAGWGNRAYSATSTTNNTIWLTDVVGGISISNVTGNEIRGSLAGIQVSNSVDYKADLASGANTASALNFTSSAGGSVTLAAIEADKRYVEVAGNADNSSQLALDVAVKGLQVCDNAVTLTSCAGVGMLWALGDASLNINTSLGNNADLQVGGAGTITLSQNQILHDFTVLGNLHIADGVVVEVTGQFRPSDTCNITGGPGAGLYGSSIAAGVEKVTLGGVTLNLDKAWKEDFLGGGVAVSENATASVSFAGAGKVKFIKSASASGDVTVTLGSLSVGTTAGAQSISAGDGVTVAGVFDSQLKLVNGQNLTIGQGVNVTFGTVLTDEQLGTMQSSLADYAIVLGNAALRIDGGTVNAKCLGTGEEDASTLEIKNGGLLNITGSVDAKAANDKSGTVRLSHWGYKTTFKLDNEAEFRVLNAIISTGDDGSADITATNNSALNLKGLRMRDRVHVNINSGSKLNLGVGGIINPTNNANTELVINGGTLGALSAEGWSGAQDITIAGGSTVQLAVYDVNTKTYSGSADIALNGVTNLSGSIALSGGGTLSLSNAALSAATTFTGEAELALSGRQSIAYNLTHTTGVTRLEDFECSGKGALTLGAAVITGELKMMNSEGGAISTQSFTTGEGATLAYGTEGQLAQLGSIGGKVSLNLYGVMSQLTEGVDLGFTQGTKTLEEIKAMLTVIDLSDYTLSVGGNGNVFLTSTATLSTDWDENWGATLGYQPTLTEADKVSLTESHYTDTTDDCNLVELAGSNYDKDKAIAIELQGASKADTVVIGGVRTGVDGREIGETLEKDVWIKATAGTYRLIVGGSWNESGDGSTAGRYLVGDTHILVDGANVNNIIGGHIQDDSNPMITGDTYISVLTDTVSGSIIGSSTNNHNATIKHTGDTNIFIYAPLSSEDTVNIPTNTKLSTNAVIGGMLHLANTEGTAILTGNTNITVDIDNAATGAQFTKLIVGGHYNADWNHTQALNGNTNVLIDAPNVSFTKDIIAGSRQHDSKASSIAGSTNLVIKGGTFTEAKVYGGSYLSADVGLISIGSTNVSIQGGTIANLVAGSYLGDSLTRRNALNANMGAISTTVTAGEIRGLLGGSYVNREHAESTVTQGDITITLTGGSITGDVYAGGEQANTAKISTASTQVTIGAGVTIADGKTISGGYKLAEGKSGSTVTGDSTLVLNAAQNRSGVNFKDFNKITASANATIGSISNTAAVTKNGTGILTLGAATNSLAGGLTVSEGGLATAAATTLGGALTMSNGTSLNLSNGVLTLAGDSGAALSLTGVALTTGTLGETNTLISGISALTGYTSGEVAASTFFSSINNIANLSSYKVKVENGSLILLHSSVPLYWEGGDGNWSSSGWAETDGATTGLGDFVPGADVTFSNTASTITVDTNASVGTMTVSGAAYTFNRTGSNTITASSLVIGENASAIFGAGSLNYGELTLISVSKGGLLDLSGMTDGGNISGLMKKLTIATGDGTVDMGHGWARLDTNGMSSLQFQVNIKAVDQFEVDNRANSAEWIVTKGLRVIDGTAADKNGILRLSGGINLSVQAGGDIWTDGAIILGHVNNSLSNQIGLATSGKIKADSIGIASDASQTAHTFTMQGGTLELTGTAGIAATIDTQITGGTLKTGDNSWSITGAEIGGSTAGAVTIETGTGTITLNNVNLTSALTNKGKLALSGTINIVDTAESAWNPAEVDGTAIFRDGAGTEGDNGFRHTSKDYTILTSSSTGTTTTATGVTWQLNGAAIDSASSFADGVLNVVAAADADKAFWVNSGTVNYGSIGTEGQEGYVAETNTTGAATLKLNGGTLALNKALGETTITVNAASTIHMAAGVTLAKTSITGQTATNKVTMQGADDTAVFNMGSNVDVTGLDFITSDWKGTVTIEDATNATIAHRNLKDLGNAGSRISINGLTGWIDRSAGVDARIILGEKGITLTDNSADGGDDNNYIFTGGVSGTGDFTLATTSTYAPVFVFSGDMSGWEGGFVINQSAESTSAPNVTLKMTGGGSLFKAATAGAAAGKGIELNRAGTLTVTIGTTTEATTMNGGIANTAGGTINLTTVGTTTLAGALSNTGTGAFNLTNNGELSLVNDTTLSSLANTKSVNASGKTLTVTGGITGIAEGTTAPEGYGITAGALTLQGASNTVGALTLTGALTLGTAEAVSRLDAGTLNVGAVTLLNVDSAVKDQQYTSIIAATSLSQSMVITMSDALLKSKLGEAAEKTITLLTLGTALADGTTVTLAGLTEDAAAAATQISVDGTTKYTLGWDTDKKVLTLTAELLGSGWKGLDVVDDAGNADLALWSEATSWSDAAVPTKETVVKLDGSAGGQQTIWMEGTANAAKTLTVDHLIGYELKGVDSTAKDKLTIEEKLAVNRGTLNLRGVDVEVKGNLELNSDAASVQNWHGNQLSIGGNLANNGTIYNAVSATLKVTGDVTNIGNITNDGSIEVTGGVTNTGTMALQKGTTTITGAVDNDGSIEVTGGSLSTGAMDNTNGTITISGGLAADGETPLASVTVNGDLDNTNGTINIGSAAVADNSDTTDIDETADATYGSLKVTGDLTHAGENATLTVESGSSLEVGGDLTATGMTLAFGGDVQVGGKATIGDLTNDGSLTVGKYEENADGEYIRDDTGKYVLAGEGDTGGIRYALVCGTGGGLDVEFLHGAGDVTVGENGEVNIKSSADFTGKLTNYGKIVVGTTIDESGKEYGATIDQVTDQAGSIESPIVTIGGTMVDVVDPTTGEVVFDPTTGEVQQEYQSASGVVMEDLVTDEIRYDNMELVTKKDATGQTYDAPILTVKTIASTATGTDEYGETIKKDITLHFTQLESSAGVTELVKDLNTWFTPDATGKTPKTVTITLLKVEDSVDANVDEFVLSDFTSETSDYYQYWQQLLHAGYKLTKLTDTTRVSTFAFFRAAANPEKTVTIGVEKQTLAEATWTLFDENGTLNTSTQAGTSIVQSSTTTDGVTTIVLNGAGALQGVEEVVVNGDAVINLASTDTAADKVVEINGLAGDKELTIVGVNDYVSIDDTVTGAGGTTTRTDGAGVVLRGVNAKIDLEGDTVSILPTGDPNNPDPGVKIDGTLTDGALLVDKATANASNGGVLNGLDLVGSEVQVVVTATDGNGTTETGVLTTAVVDGIMANGLVDLGNYNMDADSGFQMKHAKVDADGNLIIEDSVTYNKYFANLKKGDNGKVTAERNTSYYANALGSNDTSSNGAAGMALADEALVALNPQADAPDGGLSKMLSAMDQAIATGNTSELDELGAALAGASTAVLGMAAHGDLDRQLQAIRNRTTTMGVDQSVVHHDMPYFNAWINAEGDYSELSDDGTEGGYKLNSWGGTVGFDVDITPTFTAGMALTAMYGDLDVTGADTASGELNTYYVSAFARYCASAWTHTFVATAGLSDITLDRTVMGEKVNGETDGVSFGLMYEVGRVFALDEDGTACLQPIFNVTWRHTSVSGYTEDGSDLALKVDEQTLDTVTFGVGARLQAIVGESMYNRTSIFECRLLAKFDAGDRSSTNDVALAALDGDGMSASVESAERGGMGLEAGAGLTIPLGDEGGSLFMDAAIELRADYTNVNGTVGYRVNF